MTFHTVLLEQNIINAIDVFQDLNLEMEDAIEDASFTRLHASSALVLGYGSITPQLLESEFRDINTRDRAGRTPLHWASLRGDAEAIRLLLRSVDASRLDFLLKRACSKPMNIPFVSQIQYAVTMLTASASNSWKADHSLRDRAGRTCFHYAARSANMESIIQLQEAGCLVNALDNDEYSVVHHARNAEVINLLVRNGAEIDHVGYYGITPLQCAIRSFRQTDVIECYLRHGGSIHAITNAGNDAFALAIVYNHCEALKVLIDAEKSCVRLNPCKCRQWRSEATHCIAHAPTSTRPQLTRPRSCKPVEICWTNLG